MDDTDNDFLQWLANRLIYKHGYDKDDPIVSKLLSFDSDRFSISDSDLDHILSKYYTGFFLEKTDDCNIGYTDKERDDIRNYVRSLMADIVNKNIPSQILK